MKHFLTLIFVLGAITTQAQNLYFPPLVGNAWDTLSPTSLGWCKPKIDSLYSYLDAHNTDAFIVLKNGKLVLEKYFGTFTKDSIHYWASAGKSLTGTLVGMAQERNLLITNAPVKQYLGTGWTAAPAAKENLITVKHLLTMTSGLDETPTLPCGNEDTARACLQYSVDAGTRWAYHTGAYRKLQAVLGAANGGISYNNVTNTYVGSRIGMAGAWYNGVYYSKARSMARFGLLALGKGVWAADTLLHDANYFTAMTNTSQNFNLAYGYLWWLNGKASYMSPQLQLQFSGSLMPNAPNDMFSALGKNDQKIYVVPSQNLVVIRMGESAYGSAAAFSPFDNELWGKLNDLGCVTKTNILAAPLLLAVAPNPADNSIDIITDKKIVNVMIYNVLGELMLQYKPTNTDDMNLNINSSALPNGIYTLTIVDGTGARGVARVLVQH